MTDNIGDDYGSHRPATTPPHDHPGDGTRPRSRGSANSPVVPVVPYDAVWRAFVAEPEPSAPIPYAGVSAGELIGHRLWWVQRFNGRDYLRSLTHARLWVPNQAVSGDVNVEVTMGIPGGVYSYKNSASLLFEVGYWKSFPTSNRVGVLIRGRIKMWGEVVEHEEGYRAQYAKVLSLDAVVWDQRRLVCDLDDLREFYLGPSDGGLSRLLEARRSQNR